MENIYIPVCFEEKVADVLELLKEALVAHGDYYNNTKKINKIDFNLSTPVIVGRA